MCNWRRCNGRGGEKRRNLPPDIDIKRRERASREWEDTEGRKSQGLNGAARSTFKSSPWATKSKGGLREPCQ